MTWIDWLMVILPILFIGGVALFVQPYVKGVADFMAGGRCAGRYLIANARGEMGMAVVGSVAAFEVFYQAGFSMGFWEFIRIPTAMFVALFGFVIYRYRETRAMTLAQFFEIRYNKSFRIFAGFMAFLSGILNYGIFPAVASRFFVFFCGLPQNVDVLGIHMPTFAIIMAIYLSISLSMTLAGGQLTIMVTDCVEGLLSMVLFIIVIVTILLMFSWQEMHEALAAVPAGKSMLNPFDAGKVQDFNIWFILIGLIGGIYNTMAWQGGHAFNSSASSAHEAKMAGIISNWRGYGKMLFSALLALAAYTYLKHPDFASGAEQVRQILSTVDNPQIVKQMQMPVALGLLLPIGVKGIVCALFLMGLIACDGSYLHSWGSILIQDVVVPLRKTPLSPKHHLRLLRLAIVGVALFGFFFSLLFTQTEYILMFFAITGAIYLGGAGSVIIGGLYWKKGTAAAAWTAMLVGSILAATGIMLQQPFIWKQFSALMLSWPDISLPNKLPINGQWIFLITMVSSAGSYILVSLLTCKEPFNMDRMLHRGIYSLDKKTVPADAPNILRKFKWGSLIGINKDFTSFDKAISISVFSWKMLWVIAGFIMLFWNLFDLWPLSWWSNYWYIKVIMIPIGLTLVTTVWFVWGGIHDLIILVSRLKTMKRNERDDGTVVGHHNLDEENVNDSAVSK
jgi:SSS family solute:Na+ symporter